MPGLNPFWSFLLIIGLILRILHAVLHDQIVYPDEHFQSLEPANYLVSKIGWLSWEWQLGARNWLVPGLYTPLLGFLQLLGVTGGWVALAACRILMALVSCYSLFQFHRLLLLRNLPESAHNIAWAAIILFPPLLIWNTTTLSETWASVLLWSALPFLIRLASRPTEHRVPYLAAGFILGFLVALRYQMILWVLPYLGVWAMAYKPSQRAVFWTGCGLALALAMLGLLDALTWGWPFRSAWVYLEVNLKQGLADKHGISPWYEYLSLLWSQFHVWLWLGIIPFLIHWRRMRWNRIDLLVLLPMLAFFVFHSALGHKELRFISPIFPAFFYGLALGLQTLGDRVTRLRPALAMAILLLAGASFAGAGRSSYYMSYDMIDAARYIADQAYLRKTPRSCLALFQAHWVWTRGDMLQGQPATTVQIDPKDPDLRRNGCKVALVYRGWLKTFEEIAGPRWRLAYTSRAGDGVYIVSEIEN